MALFEYDNGHLVRAQLGYNDPQGVDAAVLSAVRRQILEVVARPLFPVAWSHVGQNARLTALDVAGQIVVAEVLPRLDTETLIDSLSRLADAASLSWADLSARFPEGPGKFSQEWHVFKQECPPLNGAGPRMIIVAGKVDDEVRPALDVLAPSGVEVLQMTLRRTLDGRVFLSVTPVGNRVYGEAPAVASSAAKPAAVDAPQRLPEQNADPYAGTPSVHRERYVQRERSTRPAQARPGIGQFRRATAVPAPAAYAMAATSEPLEHRPYSAAQQAQSARRPYRGGPTSQPEPRFPTRASLRALTR